MRRNKARYGAHPWLWALPFPLLTAAVALIANAIMGVPVKAGLIEAAAAAPFVWLIFRWYMPWIARRTETRRQRRYGR